MSSVPPSERLPADSTEPASKPAADQPDLSGQTADSTEAQSAAAPAKATEPAVPASAVGTPTEPPASPAGIQPPAANAGDDSARANRQGSEGPAGNESGEDATGKRRILIGSQRDPSAYRPRRRDWIPVETPGTAEGDQGAAAGAAPTSGDRPGNRPPRHRRGPQGPRPGHGGDRSRGGDQSRGERHGGRQGGFGNRPHEARPAGAAPRSEQPHPAAKADTSAAAAASEAAMPGPADGLSAVNPAMAERLAAAPTSAVPSAVPSASPAPGDVWSAPADLPAAAAPPSATIEPPGANVSSGISSAGVSRGNDADLLNRRRALLPELEDEFAQALADAPLDDLLMGRGAAAPEAALEPDSRVRGRVLAVRRDQVFIDLGSREQGVVPLAQFAAAPELGAFIDVQVQRLQAEEGLYELVIPGSAVSVENWSDLQPGAVVEARITGHNTGGLECEVNHIRGFIPVSHIALYRVEDLAQFVGQSWPCLVMEANAERRKLVLSRRAVLERERQNAKQKMLESLRPGDIREGVVRKLMDFGAFVELDPAVDGLIHISQLAWFRVSHPSEILSEGQRVEVRIEKVDPVTGKISLGYRELQQSPWSQAAEKYPPHTVVRGRVAKTMEFGAFVALEPGVEGLVHISELSHKRVWRTTDVVTEGQEVEVLVLSCDAEAQRISLSMKALLPAPKPKAAEGEEGAPAAESEPAAASAKPRSSGPQKPLRGGLGRGSGGAAFGLKW